MVIYKVAISGTTQFSYDPKAVLPTKGQSLEVLFLARPDVLPFSVELSVGTALTKACHEDGAASCGSLVARMPEPSGTTALLPSPVLVLRADVPTSAYLAVASLPGVLSPPTVYPILADKLNRLAEPELALCLWQRYATLYPTGPRHAKALLAQVDLFRATGQQAEADSRFAALQQAMAEIKPGAKRELTTVGYDLNRTFGDILATYQSRSPDWHDGTPETWLPAWFAACPWPPDPRYRPQVLQAVKAALGRPDALAAMQLGGKERTWVLHGFAQLLSDMGDRTAPSRAKLSANQARLNEISSPLPVADMVEVIGLLRHCLGDATEPAEKTKAKADAWYQAELAGTKGDAEGCARAFAELAEQWPEDAIAPYAVLCSAQWLHYAGHYRKARKAYAWARSAGSAVALYADYGLAEIQFARGEYADAYRQFGRLAEGAIGERMGEWLAYRQAQSLEFQGLLGKALDRYRVIAESTDLEQAALAQLALQRIEGRDGITKAASRRRRTATYVGEDRATRGDWWTYYGSEAFVLCAQHSPRDVSGGEIVGWEVTGRTGNTREVMRHWTSNAEESRSSFLWDPVTGKRRAANWDDRGEVYARGTGPDLWLDVKVPEGEHRLSLYFVNDANYYESDRVYVVSVYDADGNYQTGTEVRHFVNGVYKQFAVVGPARLRIRLERGLSLNVLLAGVFLDSRLVPDLPTCFRRQKEWEKERENHWSSVDEREACEEAIAAIRDQLPSAELAHALENLALRETEAGRIGPGYWAATARGDLLQNDKPALADHYRQLAELYLQPRTLTFPSLGKTILARPYAEAAFAGYVATLFPTQRGEDAREFCRQTVRSAGGNQTFRGRLAYAELARVHGETPLTDEDRALLVALSPQTADTIERLEAYRKQMDGRPPTAELELKLLSAYLRENAPDQAVAVANRLGSAYRDSAETANALYLLWYYFDRIKQTEPATRYRQELKTRFPNSSWEHMACKREERSGERALSQGKPK